ncbi:MAG: exodeoxyribonuclease VII large subunit [Nitrospirae bacterium]|nr:exodeoxyribonuclease VII large subunit [Nitrospirota bacterium]
MPNAIFTVSALTRLLRESLEEAFPDVWVEGEVSNLRVPQSGHCYFTLKDEGAQIRAVFFRNASRLLRFELLDGLAVIARGRVSVYAPRGEYQIVVEYLEPKGIGALQLAFEQLKERLAREGLFDPERKRPLPMLPRRVGIVTSPTGAALRDMLQILERRYANLEILIYPVPVQGASAAPAIAQAVAELGERGDLDVLIVGRGGGSLEDLWAFNEEIVARAIAACSVPVISAVGHETDFTIADFVADLRAPTPSAAAELVIGRKEDLAATVATQRQRLALAFRRRFEGWRLRLQGEMRALPDVGRALDRFRQRLDELQERLAEAPGRRFAQLRERLATRRGRLEYQSPRARLERLRLALGEMRKGIRMAVTQRLRLARKEWEGVSLRLDALSPLAVLARGYSITRRVPSQAVVRDASEVSPGEEVAICLHRGGLRCEVKQRSQEADAV